MPISLMLCNRSRSEEAYGLITNEFLTQPLEIVKQKKLSEKLPDSMNSEPNYFLGDVGWKVVCLFLFKRGGKTIWFFFRCGTIQ